VSQKHRETQSKKRHFGPDSGIYEAAQDLHRGTACTERRIRGYKSAVSEFLQILQGPKRVAKQVAHGDLGSSCRVGAEKL